MTLRLRLPRDLIRLITTPVCDVIDPPEEEDEEKDGVARPDARDYPIHAKTAKTLTGESAC